MITTDQRVSGTYINYLKRELAIMGRLLNAKRKVVQLHFGGGTPTFLTLQEIRDLGRWIHARFDVSPDIEAGVEIDPRRLTHDHLAALREVGFNRASLGSQRSEGSVNSIDNSGLARECRRSGSQIKSGVPRCDLPSHESGRPQGSDLQRR